MNMRTQLKGSSVRVVEVAPPTVATDLHRDRENPDDNKKENNKQALDLPEFMGFFSKAMKDNRETIGAGMSIDIVDKWYGAFGETYDGYASKYEPNKST